MGPLGTLVSFQSPARPTPCAQSRRTRQNRGSGMPQTRIDVQPADPRGPDGVQLIAELDALLRSLYPPESNHLLDPEALCGPNVVFMIAYIACEPDDASPSVRRVLCGCGAVVHHADDRAAGPYAELKRIFVRPEFRGERIGSTIVTALETVAQQKWGPRCLLRLETGVHQHAALRLYARLGYVRCRPFGEYTDDPLSICMEKTPATAADSAAGATDTAAARETHRLPDMVDAGRAAQSV